MSGGSSWRTVVGIGFIWPAILTVGIQFMPESPRWLASRGRLDEAQHALAVARGVNASEAEASYHLRREAEEIRASVEYERSVRGGWLDCFRVENKTLYRTFLGVYFPFGIVGQHSD
jgi:SP family sugar:H+ symporter-like MFS transporter